MLPILEGMWSSNTVSASSVVRFKLLCVLTSAVSFPFTPLRYFKGSFFTPQCFPLPFVLGWLPSNLFCGKT